MAPHRTPQFALKTLGAILATVAASSLPILAAAPAARAAATATSTVDSSSAQAQAEASGVPVEVTALTTETSQVMAQPNGTFVLTANKGPVRAMTSNGWRPIDTTLAAASNGTFSPKVTTAPTVFSGGGNTLLVSIGTSSEGINAYWPTTLPTPTVSGNTITYPNVRPDIDLELTAQPTGFTETMIVKTPQAAAALQASPIQLNAVGEGLSVTQNADGSVVGTDSSGNVRFGGPTPIAWDSSVYSGDPTDRPNAVESANGIIASLGQITSVGGGGTKVSLSVPAALRNNTNVVYPIYLDPTIGDSKYLATRTVESGGQNYDGTSTNDMRVGYCGWPGCTAQEGNAKTYLRFNTDGLVNSDPNVIAHVDSATVTVYETWSAESSPTDVNLGSSGSFSDATTYPGPYSSTLQTARSNCGWTPNSSCGLPFSNSNITNYLQSAANGRWSNTTFGLAAPAENDASYWKKFNASNNGNTSLQVVYNFPPNTPDFMYVSNFVACPNHPNYVNTRTPAIGEQAKSNNGVNTSVRLNFQAVGHPISDPTLTQSGASPLTDGNPEVRAYWSPTPTLKDGTPYSIRAYASTAAGDPGVTQLNSGWTGYTDITVDATAPPRPSVTSFAYPQGFWGATNGNRGTFTFTSPGAAGFEYSLDNAGSAATLTPGQCNYNQPNQPTNNAGLALANNGTYTYQPPSLNAGYHTLDVKAFDDAHNLSSDTVYGFYVTQGFTGASSTTLFEAESLQVKSSTAQTGYTYTDNSSASATTSSGGAVSELVSDGNTTPATFSYTLNPSASGYYALGVELLTGNHNAQATFQVNGNDVYDPTHPGQLLTVDTCTSTAGSMFVPLGGFRLDVSTDPTKQNQPVTNTLTVRMVGADNGLDPNHPTNCASNSYDYYNPAPSTIPSGYPPSTTPAFNDKGYSVGVDYMIMAPLQAVTPLTLQGAFNSHGIGIAGTNTGANLDGTSTQNAIDSNTGVSSGATVSVGGVTFQIPAAVNGNDNVIAAGQTITLNAPPPGPQSGNLVSGYVDFLVASTCGSLQPSAAREFTIDFGDTAATWTDRPAPAVADWLSSVDQNAAGNVPMGDYIQGPNGTTMSASDAYLYLVKVPISGQDGGKSIASVTLPRAGSDLTENNPCGITNNALHVFAIATSTN